MPRGSTDDWTTAAREQRWRGSTRGVRSWLVRLWSVALTVALTVVLLVGGLVVVASPAPDRAARGSTDVPSAGPGAFSQEQEQEATAVSEQPEAGDVFAVQRPVTTGPLTVEGTAMSSLVATVPGSRAIYVVGEDGLYRSASGGRRWEKAGPPPPEGRIVAAVDNPLLLMAGDHPPCGRGDDETPLRMSRHGGAMWGIVEGVTGIRPLAIWHGAGLAVGASCAGLQISTDGGRTWESSDAIEPGWDVTAFGVLQGQDEGERLALIASTSEGGTSRLQLLDLADPANPTVSDVLKEYWGGGVVTGKGSQLVLGASDGVWISIDNGATWTQRRHGLEEVTLSSDPLTSELSEEELQRGFGINAIAIDPNQINHMYAGTSGGLYKTTDAGATWHRVEGIDEEVSALLLTARSGRLFVETETGVMVTPHEM